jgi:hypothetical protein
VDDELFIFVTLAADERQLQHPDFDAPHELSRFKTDCTWQTSAPFLHWVKNHHLCRRHRSRLSSNFRSQILSRMERNIELTKLGQNHPQKASV